MPVGNHGNMRAGYNPSEGARQPEHTHRECTNTRSHSHTPNQGGMNIQTQSFSGRSSFVTRRDKGNSQPTALWSEKVSCLDRPHVTSYRTARWSPASLKSFQVCRVTLWPSWWREWFIRGLSRWMEALWLADVSVVFKTSVRENNVLTAESSKWIHNIFTCNCICDVLTSDALCSLWWNYIISMMSTVDFCTGI